MKRFWGFVKKEFFHIFRDVRTLLIIFGMPIAQILVFGFVITNEIRDAKIAVYDKSKDNVTNEIVQKLLSSGYFLLTKNISNEKEIGESLKSGSAKVVIVFEDNFAKNLEKEKIANIQILADASDPNSANMVVSYATAIIQTYVQNENINIKSPMQIKPVVRMLYNENLKGAYMFIPGTIALILMLISAMMTSVSIAREKEMGTMEVLLVSPLKPIHIILGKVTPYVLLSFINAVVIIILGNWVFDVPVKGNIVLLLAESLLYISMALSLGILISTVSKSQQIAMFISMFALMLPSILLSGFIYPIENMPNVLQWFSLFMPPRYFISILKDIMLKGVGFMFVWKETAILLGMTLVFIILSVKKFKQRLE
ncbi:MAG: ABC transporter permease [Bacteroidota bacterium]|nr:ABC transporter permease [Bacteroidota bacterium]